MRWLDGITDSMDMSLSDQDMVGNNSIRCPTDWLECFRFLVPLRKFEASGTGIVRALSIALPSCFQKQYIQPDLDSGSLAPVLDSQVPGWESTISPQFSLISGTQRLLPVGHVLLLSLSSDGCF